MSQEHVTGSSVLQPGTHQTRLVEDNMASEERREERSAGFSNLTTSTYLDGCLLLLEGNMLVSPTPQTLSHHHSSTYIEEAGNLGLGARKPEKRREGHHPWKERVV